MVIQQQARSILRGDQWVTGERKEKEEGMSDAMSTREKRRSE
jgi:hypothetical protein